MEKIGEFFSEYGELLLCGLPVLALLVILFGIFIKMLIKNPKSMLGALFTVLGVIPICEQHKGTILVIKKNADELAQKYQDLAILTKKVKLDSVNVKKLSSIDGAILMDENCICHGFGAVLDGLDSGCGNRARGSRFNSSERFYTQYKNENDTDFMVFILSDDGNYNFFPPLEKYL